MATCSATLPPLRFVATLCIGLTVRSWLPAQGLPAPVGPGPLLCLQPGGLEYSQFTLQIVELDGDGPARPIWSNCEWAQVLDRLDQQHLLLASYDQPKALLVLDLATGKHQVLAKSQTEPFAAVRGDAVLHLDTAGDSSQDLRLHLTRWRDPAARRRLSEQCFDRFEQVAGDLAVLVTPKDAAVWVFDLRTAEGRAIWTTPENASATRCAVSPDGKHLAIGCGLPDAKGLLTVVDLASGAFARSWPNLPIQVSVLSSFSARLEIGWHDDEHLECSQTRSDESRHTGNFVFVRYNLATGAVVNEQVYADLGLAHRAPPPPHESAPPAAFRIDDKSDATRILLAGVRQPVATISEATLDYAVIAPDGRSVFVQQNEPARGLLFTTASPSGRTIPSQRSHNLAFSPVKWLPSVTAPAGTK